MKLHRIFTENKNKPDILKLTSKLFDGFTAFNATGYWKGNPEKSLCLEIITDQSSKVDLLAGRIKRANDQESVLVEVVQNSAKFI